MTTPTLQFLGAAETVTGSRFLLDTGASRVLVDAGMFQGLKQHRLRNWRPFPVDPASIDAIVLTHAHIDHSGYLPRLVKEGFAGTVWATARTRDLCAILLPDAGHLQEEEARYANRKGFSRHEPALPLFTAAEAVTALDSFATLEFGRVQVVTDDVAVTVQPAGHILGSSSVLLEVGAKHPVRVLVSGDLGRGDHPVLADPAPPPDADVVLIESTYGNRTHPDPEAEVDAVAEAISDTASRGGMVLIPAFAVDRTEVVLSLLDELMDAGRIPRLPIHADSPMALRVLDVYRDAAAAGDLDMRAEDGVLDFGADLHECHTPEESKALSDLTYPSIILSASGMATGGRVLHHLRRLLPGAENLVILSGFQAEGTRGRNLVDGARSVKMHGRYVPVRAQVMAMESLSVHADGDELVEWLGAMASPPDTVYVVHGESSASAALAERVEQELDLLAVVPRDGERVVLA